MQLRAFITGISGPELNADERAFIQAEHPWGFILFKRNIETPEQLALLVEQLKKCAGRSEAPVLIDQEGGRVQRLGPPHWPAYPPGAVFGDALRPRSGSRAVGGAIERPSDRRRPRGARHYRSIACRWRTYRSLAPMPSSATVPMGPKPGKVAAIARAVTEGLEDGGILPVLKHIPGHGRATADSHLRLPAVNTSEKELERTDFAAFQPLADLPMAMTAHVVFSALDPVHPATTSATIIRQVIRGVIGFQGLLMSDDVSMNALAGSIAERTRAIFSAGCDVVLHCNGKLDEMQEVAAETPELSGKALARAEQALASRRTPQPFDRAAAWAELKAMMSKAGTSGV